MVKNSEKIDEIMKKITCEVIAGRIAEESKQNSNKKLLSTKILSEAQDQIKSKSKSNETAEQSS